MKDKRRRMRAFWTTTGEGLWFIITMPFRALGALFGAILDGLD